MYLNLTRTHIQKICVPLQHDGLFYDKLTKLDLSHNDIISLEPPECFASIGVNPLDTLHHNFLSSLLSVAYISLRGSQIKSLYGYSFSKTAKLCYFDTCISENYIDYLDNFATETFSQNLDLKFHDSRLHCHSLRTNFASIT